ncbi:pyridoxine [Eremomyces bilateralis CBS 781.70]|uniref:glutaminase n=1 Tax=Eremomyces bilateralis CBS 781.70 TaxID=1392243 RepID=A0A6G1GDG5_9PEZI|nr:pyridoxine [Eremomyces bilateralis CBS 781.70]KAF1815909.1 pyridoxine [Eremomyces bilateralis CBS 781.70]
MTQSASPSSSGRKITVGVLALQGAFSEHVQLLRTASASLGVDQDGDHNVEWCFMEVRTAKELDMCDALIIPGGESTTMSLVAQRSGILGPLQEFVKGYCKPTWGTCAGLILLSESANRTKKGGQDLIGGLDVRVDRNHFGRQVESFESNIDIYFPAVGPQTLGTEGLNGTQGMEQKEHLQFHAIFIRAPIVQEILSNQPGIQVKDVDNPSLVVASSLLPKTEAAQLAAKGEVEVLARLPRQAGEEQGRIVAVRQGNVLGTSFHPELTMDPRIHTWWLRYVRSKAYQ